MRIVNGCRTLAFPIKCSKWYDFLLMWLGRRLLHHPSLWYLFSAFRLLPNLSRVIRTFSAQNRSRSIMYRFRLWQSRFFPFVLSMSFDFSRITFEILTFVDYLFPFLTSDQFHSTSHTFLFMFAESGVITLHSCDDHSVRCWQLRLNPSARVILSMMAILIMVVLMASRLVPYRLSLPAVQLLCRLLSLNISKNYVFS